MKKTSHITRYTQQKNKPRVTLSSKSQTPALSLGERENRSTRFRQSRAPRLVAARDAVFPLPEGKGEGEPDVANQNGRTNLARSTRLALRQTARLCPALPQNLTFSCRRQRWRDARGDPNHPLALGRLR